MLINTKAIYTIMMFGAIFCSSQSAVAEWTQNVNNLDGQLAFECQPRQYLAGVRSTHNNEAEDRQFQFLCYNYTPSSSSVGWSGYINQLDMPFSFSCPVGQYIVGIQSEHNNATEDRIFQFKCAGYPPSPLTQDRHIKWSGYVNIWDSPVNYTCPHGQYVVGIGSLHSNEHEDRIFSFGCAP